MPTIVAAPSRQSLHALLFALVAEGGPSAYRFAMTVLQQEHQAAMAMLDAWGKSLRANAKLEKKAHARAQKQVRARLSALRRSIELSRAQHSHLRQAGLRAERYAAAHADGWGQRLRPSRASARLDESPGLAPAPPTPLAGAGGLQLRRPLPGGDLLDI